jgi:hypothetical protein
MFTYQVAFLIGTLGFFTISNAKRDDYILTALPSYAILIAAPFANKSAVDITTARLADTASCAAALSLLSLALAGLVACTYGGSLRGLSANLHPSDAKYLTFFLSESGSRPVRIGLIVVVAIVTSAMALRLAWNRRGRIAAFYVAFAQLAVLSLWIGVLMPEFARQHTLKSFVLDARTMVANHGVMIAGLRDYEVSYYFGRGVPSLPKHFRPGTQAGIPTYLFVPSQQLEQVREDESLRGSVVLASHPVSGRGRMFLLNLDRNTSIGMRR